MAYQFNAIKFSKTNFINLPLIGKKTIIELAMKQRIMEVIENYCSFVNSQY